MQRSTGVFNTDQVNKTKMYFPASVLMKAEESHYKERSRKGIRLGIPVNIGHDKHRLIGWTHPQGLYIDSSMVRVLGCIEVPESENEKRDLLASAKILSDDYHNEGAEAFRDELLSRIRPTNIENVRFLNLESFAASRPGIAAELYPDIFTPGKGPVDKDGLVDYHYLLKNMEQIQPGVFHDKCRDLLLFAHRYFRRSLSHQNSLNTYFLQSYDSTVTENKSLIARLKLDPDILGHPNSAHSLVELEYWRGPLYDDDISSIPNGVAEYKADESVRFYEGVDRTQIWWKAPESRQLEGKPSEYRTFEIEELIEEPSGGLNESQYGCRYAHAEFSADEAAITHFDGAIRAYSAESYFKRIDASIDRAGKHSDYTKVFRLDGNLPIPHWKRLLSDYYRGNKLIPEYFNSPPEVDEIIESEEPTKGTFTPSLVALISLNLGSIEEPFNIIPEHTIEFAGKFLPYLEIGIAVGAVAKYLLNQFNLENVTTVGYMDKVLNMSRLIFGSSSNTKNIFSNEITALSNALCQDVKGGLVRQAAIPLTWEIDGLLITLTIAGEGNHVAELLKQLPTIVDPTQLPSVWIESLSNSIKTAVNKENLPVMWHDMDRDVLRVNRHDEVEIEFKVPEALMGHIQNVSITTIKSRNK